MLTGVPPDVPIDVKREIEEIWTSPVSVDTVTTKAGELHYATPTHQTTMTTDAASATPTACLLR